AAYRRAGLDKSGLWAGGPLKIWPMGRCGRASLGLSPTQPTYTEV
ncbi:hypothetical protein TMEN_7157, partial [Trichophyton mentagrophytes]